MKQNLIEHAYCLLSCRYAKCDDDDFNSFRRIACEGQTHRELDSDTDTYTHKDTDTDTYTHKDTDTHKNTGTNKDTKTFPHTVPPGDRTQVLGFEFRRTNHRATPPPTNPPLIHSKHNNFVSWTMHSYQFTLS